MKWLDLGNPVWRWWLSLSTIGALNLAAWLAVRSRTLRGLTGDPEDDRLQRRMLWLAFVYASVCAFRSVVPRADVQRITLVDHWIATVFVGRAAATCAELAFVGQWALAMGRLAEVAGVRVARALAAAAVPVIAVAECFSWYAVISTNYLGNVVEESLWATVGLCAVIACALLWPRFQGRLQRVLAVCVGCGLVYVLFMVLHDVPMYVTRWRAAEAAGQVYFTLQAGLRDVATRCVVTHSLDDWREEMPWMTFYFTLSVWFSLALAAVSLRRPSVTAALRR